MPVIIVIQEFSLRFSRVLKTGLFIPSVSSRISLFSLEFEIRSRKIFHEIHQQFYYQKYITKKGITITNAFQKILDRSNCKPNKLRVGKCNEFYNRRIKSLLEKTI